MEYYICVKDQKVNVSQEEYKEFCRFARKEKYFRESDYHNGVFSYDALDSEDLSGEDLWMDVGAAVAEQVEQNIMKEYLYQALQKLKEEDKDLILRIYFYEESLRHIARSINVPVTTLQYRHQRALRQLREEMEMQKDA